MPPKLALILCTGFVLALLYLEHKRSPGASIARWVPTIWMLIYSSRPLELWFSISTTGETGSEGSPIDRLVLSMLMVVAVIVLYKREVDWSRILNDNVWLLLLFLYMGFSILWSDIPFASFKRWFRSSGDILLALVVLTDRKPFQALESVLRRCAYILIPFSLMLSKYFPQLGRVYGNWSGLEMWTGVTLQKNSLGQLCALSAVFLVWSLVRERRSAGRGYKGRSQTTADVVVLFIAVFLLIGPSSNSRSATSVAIFMIGVAILFLLYRREYLARLIARHLKGLAVTLALAYVLLYDALLQLATFLLHRDSTLTGRTEIWRPLLEFASRHSIWGVGYGGFWAPGNAELEALFTSQFNLTQAHNGYLAMYVELGIVGMVFFALFFLSFCGRIRRTLEHAYEWGVYGMCLLPMLLIHNNGEVDFMNSSSYLWSNTILLTVVFSSTLLDKKEIGSSRNRYVPAQAPSALRGEDDGAVAGMRRGSVPPVTGL